MFTWCPVCGHGTLAQLGNSGRRFYCKNDTCKAAFRIARIVLFTEPSHKEK